MSTHRALVIPTPESHPNLSITTLKTPIPKPNQLLIKVKNVSLNPVDMMLTKNNMFGFEYPMRIGSDVAGTVERLGEGVKGWKIGERVIFAPIMHPDEAALQEFVPAPADEVIKLPDNLTLEQGSAIPLCFSTAVMALYNPDRPESHKAFFPPWEERGKNQAKGKEPFVVFGGASSVGQFVIQLAKLSGFFPIITTASLNNESLLHSLGATHVIDRSSPTFIEEISSILKSSPTNSPLKLLVDIVGTKETQNSGWEVLLAEGGTFGNIALPGFIESEKLKEGVEKSGKYQDLVWGSMRDKSVGKSAGRGSVTKLLASGEIKPNATRMLPGGIEGIEKGMKMLEEKQVSALKLVVDVDTLFD